MYAASLLRSCGCAIYLPTRSTLQQLTVTELRARLEALAAQRATDGVTADHPDAEAPNEPQLIDVREESEV